MDITLGVLRTIPAAWNSPVLAIGWLFANHTAVVLSFYLIITLGSYEEPSLALDRRTDRPRIGRVAVRSEDLTRPIQISAPSSYSRLGHRYIPDRIVGYRHPDVCVS